MDEFCKMGGRIGNGRGAGMQDGPLDRLGDRPRCFDWLSNRRIGDRP